MHKLTKIVCLCKQNGQDCSLLVAVDMGNLCRTPKHAMGRRHVHATGGQRQAPRFEVVLHALHRFTAPDRALGGASTLAASSSEKTVRAKKNSTISLYAACVYGGQCPLYRRGASSQRGDLLGSRPISPHSHQPEFRHTAQTFATMALTPSAKFAARRSDNIGEYFLTSPAGDRSSPGGPRARLSQVNKLVS